MESRERLAPPSPVPSSFPKASSSTSSSPAPNPTLSTKCSPAPIPEGSTSLTICGHSLRLNRDEHSKMNANPTLGLYSSGSSSLDFGGLGCLGLSALAAHPRFDTFPDWLRPSEAFASRMPAFFPPLLDIHSGYFSTYNNSNLPCLQPYISGINGAINGKSTSSSAVNMSSFPAKENKSDQMSSGQKSKSTLQSAELHHQNVHKAKKYVKRQLEKSSTNDLSDSDSSSDEEECSSDPDDLDQDENDDLTSDSEESDSIEESPAKRKCLTHSTSESKKRKPCATDENITQQNNYHSTSLSSSYFNHAGLTKSTTGLSQSARTVEEKQKSHTSVIQTTGLALSNGSSTQFYSEASSLPSKFSSSISFPSSSKHSFDQTSSKQHFSSFPKPLIFCSTKKSPPLCSSPKPSLLSSSSHYSISSLPKTRTFQTPVESLHNCKIFMSPGALTHTLSDKKASNGNHSVESSSNRKSQKQPIYLRDSVKQASSAWPINHKGDRILPSNFYSKEDMSCAVQDAPLALITKPRNRDDSPGARQLLPDAKSSHLMPINLSIGAKATSQSPSSSVKSSASSELLVGTKKSPRNCQGDFHGSKDSEGFLGDVKNDEDDDDDEDDYIENEDSSTSVSDSESNLESDSDGFEADINEDAEIKADGSADRMPPKSTQSSLSYESSFNSCSVLNLQIPRSPDLQKCALPNTNSKALNYHGNPSSCFPFETITGSRRRKRVTDEKVLQLPLEFGWRRETRVRSVAGRLQGEVAYFAPCGKKLRQYPDVIKYLARNGITGISRDNFSFSTKIKVGDFYESREGQEWRSLAGDEISACVTEMDGRRSRRPKFEHLEAGDGARHSHIVNLSENNFQDVSDTKLLRKLEAQEIARQAAQIKMMRKLEKQAMAQAAKEAKKQQAIMAAEERRKKREEVKILRQQEKIKRIQQIRMEKELRAQQILEEKRKKKEAAAHAKILEAEKRNKEKEIRRLQAVILKHQEFERHRLDMERERRRQHMILMKAVEARKKAEEKERLRKEKKDEKRLNKERKLEIRRLELQKAKELKKPNEDMFLADHKPLPDLPHIPGLVLPGSTFSDCLMVLQFLRNFGKVLRLDLYADTLGIIDLQEGLLNFGDNMYKVQDLLVSMLSAAICDPGIPAGHRIKTILGDHLIYVEITRDNVSEILQMYMEGISDQTDLADVANSLKTKAFQAHSPSQKASVLAFLVNELCCSKAVISEIDKNIDLMTNLRKDKWVVEGKLRKLRSIHARTTGPGDNQTLSPPNVRNIEKGKEGESEEEEDEDDDSEEQGDEEEEEEDSGGRKGKKAEMCEDEDDCANATNIEELEKQIEKTCKLQSHIRQKLFDSSHSLRSMMIGEDRYKRRYWVLPQCGGIFVEGMEDGEGNENVSDRERQKAVKEEEDGVKKPVKITLTPSKDTDEMIPVGRPDNLFLQKPSSLSKLSKLLKVAKMTQDSDLQAQKTNSSAVPATGFPHSLKDETDSLASFPLSVAQLQHALWMTHNPKSVLQYDLLSKILTENRSEWFSLLPRSPCDGSSVTSGSSPSSSSSQPIRTNPPSSLFPNTLATESCDTTAGINNRQSHTPKQVKSGIHQSRLTQSDVLNSGTSPSLLISGTSQPSQHAEGNGNKVLCLADTDSVNKNETSVPQSDKPSCAIFPAVESAKIQDHRCPQPIPEEMLHGWWRVTDMENLHNLVKTLHSRGIREKALQKQIQKHLEYAAQFCANRKDELEATESINEKVSREILDTWCVEQQAMEVDIGMLRQVEDLERKVVSAGLQVKGWMPPEPQSDSKNLVYYEHKLPYLLALENKGKKETGQEEFQGFAVRRSDNPLDIAVNRLFELERNIEQSNEDDVAPGMRLWHKAIGRVHSSAQLALCTRQLQKSIPWERDIMKVHCQNCQKGDNEELLLLCDGCDRGCHTYCHNPTITTVPDGDWFCPFCLAKGKDQTSDSGKQESDTTGAGKKCMAKHDGKPTAEEELFAEEDASSNNMPRRSTTELKKMKRDFRSQARNNCLVSPEKKPKTSKDGNNELAICRELLAELETHQDAWPFLTPVNHKAVPGYKKIIRKPMDFSTIREKLTNDIYLNLEAFIADVNLVFDNCKMFNEDDSEIGQAGHNMRKFFDQRWAELLQ